MESKKIRPPFEVLEWDSNFFGFPVARLQAATLRNWDLVLEWAGKQGIRVAYLLVPVTDIETVKLAEEAGFRLVDVRVTLAQEVSKPVRRSGPGSGVLSREATEQDLEALRKIARCSHRQSRFYADGRFPRHLCDRLYEVWIERSVQRDGETVFVAVVDDIPVGYVTCLEGSGEGQIGLMAVAESCRRAGVGRALAERARDWFADNGVKQARVVTQGSNQGALQFYQRQGFEVASLDLWFHYWFSTHGSGRSQGSEDVPDTV